MTVSLTQMLGQRNVLRLVSEYAKPAYPLTNFFGVSRTSPHDRGFMGSSNYSWDYLDYTRRTSRAFSPLQIPPQSQEMQPRTATMTVPHFGESLKFTYDQLRPWRPLGKPDGYIDEGGVQWITQQMQRCMMRMDNTREFMLSQLLSVGSYALQRNGDYWDVIPTASASGDYVTVDFAIPAAHKSQLNVFGAGDIITATWATATNSIRNMLFNLRAASQKKYGLPITEVFINTNTFNYVMANNSMQMGGMASPTGFTIYKSMTKEPAPSDYRAHGAYDVVFHAMPLVTFHVNDNALLVNTEDETAVTSSTYNKTMIPDNVAVFTPPPSRDWLSVAQSGRTIRPRPNDTPTWKWGFHSYEVPQYGAGAAGIEHYLADSALIYPLSRYAYYIGTVIF
jgi:hypothetical protein